MRMDAGISSGGGATTAPESFLRACVLGWTKLILPEFMLVLVCFSIAFSQEDSIDSLETNIANNPRDFESVSALSRIYIAQGNYESAQDALRDYLAVDSGSAPALYLLGYAMDLGDNIPAAIRYYRESLALDSSLWMPYRNLAYLFDVFAQYDSMNYYLRSALRLSPSPESLFYDLGYSYDMLGLSDSAMVYYHRAADFDTLDSQAYLNIGAIWGNSGNLDSAAVYTEKAWTANPNAPDVCFNYAEILAGENKREDAISYFQKALALEPRMVEAKKRLGDLYESLGDSAMARIYYHEFIDSAPIIYQFDIDSVRAKLRNYK